MGKNTPASSIASITDLKTLQAEIERLKKENEALAAKRSGALSIKTSTKGAVSVYGLGRFPVTLYAVQWERLLASAEKVKGFIEENRETLATKDRAS